MSRDRIDIDDFINEIEDIHDLKHAIETVKGEVDKVRDMIHKHSDELTSKSKNMDAKAERLFQLIVGQPGSQFVSIVNLNQLLEEMTDSLPTVNNKDKFNEFIFGLIMIYANLVKIEKDANEILKPPTPSTRASIVKHFQNNPPTPTEPKINRDSDFWDDWDDVHDDMLPHHAEPVEENGKDVKKHLKQKPERDHKEKENEKAHKEPKNKEPKKDSHKTPSMKRR